MTSGGALKSPGGSMKVATRIAAAIVGTSLAIISTNLALGADIPVKAKPKSATIQAPIWEGFYVGGYAGYGFGVSRQSALDAFDTDFMGSSGFVGGQSLATTICCQRAHWLELKVMLAGQA
jgi:opacity protein-like surface antigen